MTRERATIQSGTASAAIMVTALTIAACGSGPQPGAPAPPASTAAPAAPAGPRAVDVVRVVEQPLDVPLSLPGELTAFQSVAIFPRVTGFVKSIDVDRGSVVHAGEVVAVLEAPELAAQRLEAQSTLQGLDAQLAAARAKADADTSTFDRLKSAAATPGVVAGIDVVVAGKAADASRNQVTAAEQRVDAAKQALRAVSDMESYLRVTAPFDGVVTERNVHPGALVGPSSGAGAPAPMLRIVENRRLRVVVPVPEAYTSELKTGTDIAFTVAAYPGETFTGKIARVAHAVDVNTRTMPVELDVANRDGRLASGTFCQVRWPVHRPGLSLFVPSASVASTTDRTFVIRVRDGKAEWVDIRTGLTSGPLVEVFGDLHAGDVIAARGTDELRSGMEIQPREGKPGA
ncbi:MAG: efflux RND transporter periplasmic adaptor subunit [Acidobacteriaceae bacterium]|jgi:RND family efflux transporter MFP subunit|nr:efflux RND transporter periplasmic adaptor subunit [Acidobacteriaceae bacterium]